MDSKIIESFCKFKSKRRRAQLDFHFKGVQPNVIVFYSIRSAVIKYFWDVDIHGHEADDFVTFEVLLNGECIFTRKNSPYGYPNISQVLREVYLAISNREKSTQALSPAPSTAKGKEQKGKETKEAEVKPMDLSKLDVKRWLINGKGFL